MNAKADTLFYMIAIHNNLSASSGRVLQEMMKFIDNDGLINLNHYHKKVIANEAGVVIQTVNNIIGNLKKTGIIRSIDIGTFKLSRSIFVDDYFYGLYSRTGWKNLTYELKINSSIGALQVSGAV